ncbi:copine-1-like [Montipora foliosa]|uniref:copine-1-like n=1 Tax=Montipora foliosa TaxID=591990 RepID=UPI0035F1D05F
MALKEEKRKSTPCLRNHQVAAEEHAKALNFNSRDGRMVQNHGTLKTNAFQKKRKIELFVECTDLVLLDSCTKSDPMCVLYVKRLGQWMEYGRTESIPNCFHPKFVETFIIEANKTVNPRLRFSIFDLANFTSKDLRKHDFIGSLEIELETLLESEKNSLIRTLRLPGDIKSRGYIHVYVEDVVETRSNVRLHFGATNLVKKGLLGKCDAFFEVHRWLSKADRFHPIYRSEIVQRTSSPKWAPFEISLQKLCNDNVDGQILLSCWHFSSSGNHSIFGEARLNISCLVNRTVRQVDIVNPVKRSKSKRYSNSGTLRILHCHLDKQFSLIDYVRGNCFIRMVCALDFTMSNGAPLTRDSLHTLDEERNEYVQTLEAIGKVLTTFGEDNKIPAYGFGAKATSTGPLPYMFALDSEGAQLELEKIDNVIDAYWKRLEDVSLGGPTYLAPVLQEIAAYAEKEVSQHSQHYTIGLVVVDGIINDVDRLIDKLIDVGHLPLSIVVVGVGPTDFRLMEELFSKDRGQLRSKEGKTLTRINTDFLSVRRHASSRGINESTVREISANISRQIVTFFKSKEIVPNPPRKWYVNEPWDYCSNTSDLPASRPCSPRMCKISQKVTAKCPTCGSVIEPGAIGKMSVS